MDVYTSPMLSVHDAARYLGMPSTTLGSWRRRHAIHSVPVPGQARDELPFVGVVEAYVLRTLRGMGIPMAHISEVSHTIRHVLGDDYGLARPGLGIHGRDVLIQVAGDFYRGSDLQQAVEETLNGFQEVITWVGEDPQSLRLCRLGDNVVLDPRFGWGTPVVGQSRVPVTAIIDQYLAGDSMNDIAYDFGIHRDDIEALVRGLFEPIAA